MILLDVNMTMLYFGTVGMLFMAIMYVAAIVWATRTIKQMRDIMVTGFKDIIDSLKVEKT